MSEGNGKVCCNCKHCIRAGERDIQCHCNIDRSWLSYVTTMTYRCRHWAGDHNTNVVEIAESEDKK